MTKAKALEDVIGYGQGRGNDFFIVRAGYSPPFLLPLLLFLSLPVSLLFYPVL